jgi:subtilisin family serine protease
MSVAFASIRRLVVASAIAFGVLAAPAAAFIPNDPRFGQQWALNNNGQSIGGIPGTPDADIDAAEAWDVTTGSSAVTVAMVDDGVDPGQPDLVPNLDMASGFDFGDNDPHPIAEDSGHGVQTALVLGARGNDGVGMAGVAWNVRIMPLKVRHAGTGSRGARITKEAEEAAYRYAASHGARVVGASFSGSRTQRYSDSILQAIQGAPNTLWVVSAGQSGRFNSGDDNDRFPRYPCSYPAANVICVAGSDNRDHLWTRSSPAQTSNFGATSVDLAAPASDIQTTSWNDSRTYALQSGTSYAAPQVSGAAALYLSKYPKATAAQVKNAILSGVDVLPDFVGKTVTGGRLNIARTLSIPPAGGGGTTLGLGRSGDTTMRPKGPRRDRKVVLRLRRRQRLSDVLRKGIRVSVEVPARVRLGISLRLSRATRTGSASRRSSARPSRSARAARWPSASSCASARSGGCDTSGASY